MGLANLLLSLSSEASNAIDSLDGKRATEQLKWLVTLVAKVCSPGILLISEIMPFLIYQSWLNYLDASVLLIEEGQEDFSSLSCHQSIQVFPIPSGRSWNYCKESVNSYTTTNFDYRWNKQSVSCICKPLFSNVCRCYCNWKMSIKYMNSQKLFVIMHFLSNGY